jgi:NADP-dependent 3-hydroxy acid dehydrogenase YdfG
MLLSKVEKGLSHQWRQMFDVNVLGLLYATDAAIGAMRRRGDGHVVNISSVAGRRTRPGSGVYSGTKFAVNAISEALRQELIEDKIRVTMVEPGAVETELAIHITDEEAQQGSGPSTSWTSSRPRTSPPPWPTASPGPGG